MFDKPNDRKSHHHSIPYLGGLGIFFAILFVTLIMGIMLYPNSDLFLDLKLVFSLYITLFTLLLGGLKDDLIGAKPFEKIIFQILAATFLILVGGVRILSLNGLFGVYDLTPAISFILSLFVYIFLINAFNLIDGIDGLSASISMISNLFMFFYFLKNESIFNAIIMISCSGATLSFLFFNFSWNLRKKIFLGDNGSLCLGLINAYGIILLFNQSIQTENIATVKLFENFLMIIVTLVSYPILDTLRVFVVRLYKGKSPFRADNNHIHHHLLRLQFSHKRSTLIIVFYTISLFLIAFILRFLDINLRFIVILMISTVIYVIPLISRLNEKYK